MYTTPVINGYVYQVQDRNLNLLLQRLADLRAVSQSTTVLNAQIGSFEWGRAFLEASKISTLYTQLTTEIAALATPGITSGALDVANYINRTLNIPAQFAALANEGGFTEALFNQRQALIEDIYTLRQNLPALINVAFTQLKSSYDENVILSPALQDYVLFKYALTGEAQLNEELNTLGDSIQANVVALEAIAKLNQILSASTPLQQDLSPVNPAAINNASFISLANEGLSDIMNKTLGFLKGDFTATNINLAANTWQLAFASAIPNTMSLFETGQVVNIPTTIQPENALYTITAVAPTYIEIAPLNEAASTPNTFLLNTNPVQGVYSYQQQTTLSPIVVANLFEVITDPNFLAYAATGSLTWFNTVASHTNVNNTLANLEFFKEQNTQKLNEVMFVYSKFLQSAASVLSGIDQVTSGFARRIKSQ